VYQSVFLYLNKLFLPLLFMLVLFPPLWQPPSHRLGCRLGIELLGIKRPSPFHALVVLLMFWISHRLKVFLVAIGASNVFLWAGPLAFQAQWIPSAFLPRQPNGGEND
jgi:hypothetical protein